MRRINCALKVFAGVNLTLNRTFYCRQPMRRCRRRILFRVGVMDTNYGLKSIKVRVIFRIAYFVSFTDFGHLTLF